MASSLQELLVGEGFDEEKLAMATQKKKVKFRDKSSKDESVASPIYICQDRRSFDDQSQRTHQKLHGSSTRMRRGSLDYEKSESKRGLLSTYQPAMDEVAIRAVVAVLSGYIGQYLKDKKFRESMKSKCYACFAGENKDLDNGVFANLGMGIENVERLVEETQGTKNETRMKSLKYSIRLLSIVADLNSKSSRNGSTCGIPNSYISACAQLYLSIVYKVERNDRISARHLLQVFCDAPFLARFQLLPELWDHLFLPHLLHLKIWYSEELEFLEKSSFDDRDVKIHALDEVYNAHMDIGTVKFGLYYKDWLKVGSQAPAVPDVPFPPRLNPRGHSRGYSDSFSPRSSSNKVLYRAVFGTIPEKCPVDSKEMDEYLSYHSCLEDKEMSTPIKDMKRSIHHRRSSSLTHRKSKDDFWPDSQKPDHFRFLICRSESTKCTPRLATTPTSGQRDRMWKNDLDGSVYTICTSDSIFECEVAIRVMANAWLDSSGDSRVESELSKTQVIEGILDILSASEDDEILELAISLLAKVVTKNELNTKIVLKFDPQLEIFVRLMRNSSLFLKSAVLLYLVKPKAKQMTATEWIPLVLRVLEFGDQLQTLFTIQCSPQVTAYYFLDELLFGFDEDRNKENARHIVSLGGLGLLLRRLETGDVCEMNKAASIIYCCILAERSCRHYLASNLNKQSLIPLLLAKNPMIPQGQPFALLVELFCLNRYCFHSELLAHA